MKNEIEEIRKRLLYFLSAEEFAAVMPDIEEALTRLADSAREEGRKGMGIGEYLTCFNQGKKQGAESERHRISVEVEKERQISHTRDAKMCEDEGIPHAMCEVCTQEMDFNAALTRVLEIINPKQNDV